MPAGQGIENEAKADIRQTNVQTDAGKASLGEDAGNTHAAAAAVATCLGKSAAASLKTPPPPPRYVLTGLSASQSIRAKTAPRSAAP